MYSCHSLQRSSNFAMVNEPINPHSKKSSFSELQMKCLKWSQNGTFKAEAIGKSTRRVGIARYRCQCLMFESAEYSFSFMSIQYLTLSENRKQSEFAVNAQKHNQNDENDQWLIDSEGVPKSQNIEFTKNDDDQQQQEQHQVIVSGHSMIYTLWSTLTLKGHRTEYPWSEQQCRRQRSSTGVVQNERPIRRLLYAPRHQTDHSCQTRQNEFRYSRSASRTPERRNRSFRYQTTSTSTGTCPSSRTCIQ